ncbi:MAG: OmpA family protein [Myxococcaceae bacterium]|nr:OmpA family protein [Myxococcaceae bacterium]
MDAGLEQKSKRSGALPWVLFVLTACALGAVLYFGWGLFGQERARANSAEQKLSDTTVKLAEADASRRALEERVKALEAEKAAMQSSMSALSENLEEAQAELARLKATYDSLQEKMQAEIKKGEIKLSQAGGRIQVDLVDKVLFDSGKAELSPRGVEVLTRLAGVLASVDDKLIQVSGHTDDAPPVNEVKERYPTNWELSAARAVNVVRFLAEKGKVPPKRLVAAGHGEYQPVASNATPQGRAANRRIEILLLPMLDKQKAQVAAAPSKPEAQPAALKRKSTKVSGGREK